MNIRGKRIIAKEILVFVIFIILSIILSSSIYFINRNKISNIKKFDDYLKYVQIEAKLIPKPIDVFFNWEADLRHPEKGRKGFYELISLKYDLGTYGEFLEKITYKENRQALYNAISPKYDVGTFEEFEVKLGYSANPMMLLKICNENNQRATFNKFHSKWASIYNSIVLKTKVLSATEIEKTIFSICVFIFIILYPIRLLVFLSLWAIKVLKNKK